MSSKILPGKSLKMPDFPNFIIIGAMKSATSTLQEQLELQPGIFMCSPKEPNFFSDDLQFDKGLAWYSSLFSTGSKTDLLGEASTHYTKLPTYPRTVARIKENLPDAKLIYVMRHPLDRLTSHYLHERSLGVFRENIEAAVEKHTEMIRYSQYSMQLLPFFESFGKAAICPVFFDRLVNHPQQELERICRFIGYNAEPEWHFDLAPSNISAKRIRRFPLYRLLIESDIATWIRRALVPKGIRSRIRSQLVLKQEPELSSRSQERLESIFNKDLLQLGAWLGVHLDCHNFKSVTGHKTLEWLCLDD